MDATSNELVIAAVSSFAASAALVFQSVQTRGLKRATRAQIYQMVNATWIEFDKLLLANPSLRKYVYGGASLPPTDGADHDEARTVVDIAMNVADLTLQLERDLPEPVRNAWRSVALSILETPAAVEYRRENPGYFPLAEKALEGGDIHRSKKR